MNLRKNFTYEQRRRFVSLLLVAIIFTGLNEYLEWGLFGRFGNVVSNFVLLLTIITIVVAGPDPEEMTEARRKKQERESPAE